ncbi:MAG: acyl transferase [Saprospiraceae bacterium]|nr:acyl transferase [Saprospiraceae bacterium]
MDNNLRDSLKTQILSIGLDKSAGDTNQARFDELALAVFAFQYKYNAFYRRYCSLIGKEFSSVSKISDIPFLPIQFFKNQEIKTGEWIPEAVFSSSGTTGTTTSQHFCRDIYFYKQIARQGFEQFYGQIDNFCVLGLLPSYLERSGSSLIAMVDDFIQISKHPKSGFFLNEHAELTDILRGQRNAHLPTLLIGVSFGLLDFIEDYTTKPTDSAHEKSEKVVDFSDKARKINHSSLTRASEKLSIYDSGLIVMETGGMKGRRREMIRTELHELMSEGFGVSTIHSEYGMTELFSQAYSKRNGIFEPTSTLSVFSREINDPLSIQPKNGKLGILNIIDLGNLDTCSFIATDDLGRVCEDGSFEVLGRLDNSDMRGCNLLIV